MISSNTTVNNSSERQALRGLEVPLFDLITQFLTPEERAKLLKDVLTRATFVGDRGLTQKLWLGQGYRSGLDFMGSLKATVKISPKAKDKHGRAPFHIVVRR